MHRHKQTYKRAFGGALNSAEILLSSLNFEPIEKTQRQNEWQKAGEILAGHAKILELGGVDFILICTNTMHKVYDIVQNSVKTPSYISPQLH